MQYLFGLLSGVGLFALLALAYMAGRRSRSRPAAPNKGAPEEDKEKAKRLRTGFEQLMKYDVTTALNGKKVQ